MDRVERFSLLHVYRASLMKDKHVHECPTLPSFVQILSNTLKCHVLLLFPALCHQLRDVQCQFLKPLVDLCSLNFVALSPVTLQIVSLALDNVLVT